MIRKAAERLILCRQADRVEDFRREVEVFVLDRPNVRDPLYQNNIPHWSGIVRRAEQTFRGWRNKVALSFFFNSVMRDQADKQGRKLFWLRYVSLAHESFVAHCPTALLNPGVRVVGFTFVQGFVVLLEGAVLREFDKDAYVVVVDFCEGVTVVLEIGRAVNGAEENPLIGGRVDAASAIDAAVSVVGVKEKLVSVGIDAEDGEIFVDDFSVFIAPDFLRGEEAAVVDCGVVHCFDVF
jgi:EH_Signature domain